VRRLIEYVLSLCVASLLVFLALGHKVGAWGWVRVRPEEVAVVSDYLRGTTQRVATPGLRWFVPYFQDVTVLERVPGELELRGDAAVGERVVPALSVRAGDGTRFSFEQLTLRFQLDVSRAERSLTDVGRHSSDRLLLVRALARGVLRDEFGRYSSEQIVMGASIDAARTAARERLNAHLAPHGVTVAEIPAATPRFDPGYEQQVLRRRVAEQQVELVRAERRKLASELSQRREKVTREKEVEEAVLTGDLARQELDAGTRAIARRREAEVYGLQRVAAGRRERRVLEEQAAARLARYQAEALGFAERVSAVGARGESAVRAAWIETLGALELELAPYALPRVAD
jgi:hypothetical protein